LRGGFTSWSVSDPAVALIEPVTASGVIARLTGLAAGNVDVIYTDYEFGDATGKQDSVPLTVTAGLLQSILLLPEDPVSIAAGSQQQFDAYGTYGGGDIRWITEDVIWDSSNTAVGVFDIERKGLLRTLPGTAGDTTNVSASMLDANGTLINSNLNTVTVNDATLESLWIGAPRSVVLGETEQFFAQGTFDNGEIAVYTDRVTWSSDDPGVATVSNAEGTEGEVTGVSVGTTTIRAVDPATAISETRDVSVTQP